MVGGFSNSFPALSSACPSFHLSIAPQVWSQFETSHKVWKGFWLDSLILRRRLKWSSLDSNSLPFRGSNRVNVNVWDIEPKDRTTSESVLKKPTYGTPTSHQYTYALVMLPISIGQIEGSIMWFVDMGRLPFHIFYHWLFALKNPILTVISFETVRKWLFVEMSVLTEIFN